jgi:hypothetical protein
MNYNVIRYNQEFKQQWDDFVRKAKNATFLFYRDFMEYHSDRFEDYSLMVFKKEKLLAIFPAHITATKICSHNGLTYGGLILIAKISVGEVCSIFDEIINFSKDQGIKEMEVKIIPQPYQNDYSSAFEFSLFQQNATLQRRELNYFTDLKRPLEIHKSKLKFKNKGLWDNLELKASTNFKLFWNDLLIPVLKEQYDSSPVHSLEEISGLAEKFPENIKQFNVFLNGLCIAGITLFISGDVVKSQYGVVNATGKEYRALDYLYIQLLEHFQKRGFTYFDMGSSNIGDGKEINIGLSKYKEEFGAKPYNLDRYTLKV